MTRNDYIITPVMMDNWCMITIFDLVLSLSWQVSHLLLDCGLQLSLSSNQSHPSQWLTNILLVNPSDAPHVKSHPRRMLTLFTPRCRDSGKILTSQKKNSFRVWPRQKSATGHHIRPSITCDLILATPPNWGPKPKACNGTQTFATLLSWWQRRCEFQHAT